MSLINKMLQDLDARGAQSGAAMQAEVKPVLVQEPRYTQRQMALAAVLAVLALGAATWFWFKRPAPAPAAPKPLVMEVPPPAVAVVDAPQVRMPAPPAPVAAVLAPTAAAPAPAPAPAAPPVAGQAAPRPQSPRPPRAPAAERVSAEPAPAVAPAPAGRISTPAQRAEALYGRALNDLDAGRVSGAMEAMQQALALNPRHEAARQTLVGLLLEAGRKDDAMQQLEQGLQANPAQPQLAMLLARLQIERGQSGIATLQRTLPSAAGNGDFHAFLAGALQREGRHREAVEQYVAALRSNPEQGVWLMGMGISLQASQRDADARAAFERAKAAPGLTPALQDFVERKLQQLGR